jgi:mono/diheme cytochrome c family protein
MVLRISYILFIFSFIVSCNSSDTSKNETELKQPLSKAEIKHLFESNCASCHGCDGTLGMSGAKDLSISNLKKDEIKDRIQNGKNGMPSFEGIIQEGEQMDSIVSYVISLRK